MNSVPSSHAEEAAVLKDMERILQTGMGRASNHLNLDPESTKNGLGQLVLALVKLLHELMEKQVIRRMEGEQLTEEEIERLGNALMLQNTEIDRLRIAFGLSVEDLNLDLGPLGKLY